MGNGTGTITEVVEAQGHLIDSHIMERIFDTVVEFQGKFEVEKFQIGRTNSDRLSLWPHAQILLAGLVANSCSLAGRRVAATARYCWSLAVERANIIGAPAGRGRSLVR